MIIRISVGRSNSARGGACPRIMGKLGFLSGTSDCLFIERGDNVGYRRYYGEFGYWTVTPRGWVGLSCLATNVQIDNKPVSIFRG